MMQTKPTLDDYRVEQIVASILRAGVTLAAAVVAVGAVIYLRRHGAEIPNYGTFHGEPANRCSVTGILSDALAGRGGAIIQLGLLLLIATPVVRVAFSLVAFALQRDRVYVAVTVVVLAILLYGLAGGGI